MESKALSVGRDIFFFISITPLSVESCTLEGEGGDDSLDNPVIQRNVFEKHPVIVIQLINSPFHDEVVSQLKCLLFSVTFVVPIGYTAKIHEIKSSFPAQILEPRCQRGVVIGGQILAVCFRFEVGRINE